MGLTAGVAGSSGEDNGVGGGSCDAVVDAVVPLLGYRAFLVFMIDFLMATSVDYRLQEALKVGWWQVRAEWRRSRCVRYGAD